MLNVEKNIASIKNAVATRQVFDIMLFATVI